MKIKFKVLLVVVLLLSFGISCVKKAELPDEIKIGVILPLTGPAASHGEDILSGLNLAINEINKENIFNNKKIKLIVEDNKSNPKDSVSALKKMVNVNKLPVIIGPVASGNMLAMAPIAEKSKVVLISPAASSPKISSAGDYIFRNSLLASQQGVKMANYCFKKLDKKQVAILYINDETGLGYKNSFKTKYISLGGKIIFESNYDKKGTDFRTELIKLKKINPEVVYVPSIPQTLGYILRQAKELGIKSIFLANYGAEGESLLTIAQDAAEGIYYTSIPISKDFIEKFMKVYKRKPTIGAPLGYDTLKIVVQSIKKNGYSPDNIKYGLHRINNFNGATGKISFNKNGDANKEIIIKTVKNNSFIELK